MRKNEIFGSPGISANDSITPETIHNGRLRGNSCRARSTPKLDSRGSACGHHAARHRNQQRRDHGHQSVPDGEDGVGPERLAERNVELEDPDQKAGDDIDGGNENGGQSIALAEARRAIHGAIELRLAGDPFAAASAPEPHQSARRPDRRQWPSVFRAGRPG